MPRGGRFALVAALAFAGLVAGIFATGGGASASHATADSNAITRVTVTATDSKFALSTRSAPTGTVIFAVTNKGKISHDFKIAGKKTPLLSPRRSATLRVVLSKAGAYPYLSTVSGQAAHGLKGVFTVAAAAPKPISTVVPITTGPLGTASTRVLVDMFDTGGPPRFHLSQGTMPSGMVTFVIANKCMDLCSFNLEGIKVGTLLSPGKSETWTVALTPGIYRYHCDQDPQGMNGSLTVTP